MPPRGQRLSSLSHGTGAMRPSVPQPPRPPPVPRLPRDASWRKRVCQEAPVITVGIVFWLCPRDRCRGQFCGYKPLAQASLTALIQTFTRILWLEPILSILDTLNVLRIKL